LKVKFDFITNSSSTNFIISCQSKKDVNLNTTLEIPINLSNYITKTFTTEESVKKHYGDELGDEQQEIINEIKKGNTVHILTCSDQEDSAESILCEHGLDNVKLPKGVKVLRGNGGY